MAAHGRPRLPREIASLAWVVTANHKGCGPTCSPPHYRVFEVGLEGTDLEVVERIRLEAVEWARGAYNALTTRVELVRMVGKITFPKVK